MFTATMAVVASVVLFFIGLVTVPRWYVMRSEAMTRAARTHYCTFRRHIALCRYDFIKILPFHVSRNSPEQNMRVASKRVVMSFAINFDKQ